MPGLLSNKVHVEATIDGMKVNAFIGPLPEGRGGPIVMSTVFLSINLVLLDIRQLMDGSGRNLAYVN